MNGESSQVDVLVCRLIDLCRDEQESFLAAAEEVREPQVRAFLQVVAEQRESFAQTLQTFLPAPQPEIERVMQRLEMLHQGWIDFHLARVAGDLQAILGECEQEARHALATYQRALSTELPPELSRALARQCQEARATCEQLQLLRETAEFTLATEGAEMAEPVAVAG